MIKKISIMIIIFIIYTTSLSSLEITLDTNNDNKDDMWLKLELFKDWQKVDLNKNDKPDESCLYTDDSNKIYFIKNKDFDFNGNGKPDIYIKNEIKGKILMTEIRTDENGDGEIDIIEYRKNDVIYLLKMDTNNDKVFDTVETYIDGYLNKQSVDTNNDGKLDDNYYFDHDLILKEELDSNYDGKIDTLVEFKYNSDLTTKECIIMFDKNFDGKNDEWHYSDEKRRIIRIERDLDFDGKIDQVENLK